MGNSANGDRAVCTEKCGGKSGLPVEWGKLDSKHDSTATAGFFFYNKARDGQKGEKEDFREKWKRVSEAMKGVMSEYRGTEKYRKSR